MTSGEQTMPRHKAGGLTGWLTGWLAARVFSRLRAGRGAQPRLALVERIALAPRQSLALIEAEGRRILVATSADGASAFFALDEGARPAPRVAAPFATRSLQGRTSTAPTARVFGSRVSGSGISSSGISSSRVSW